MERLEKMGEKNDQAHNAIGERIGRLEGRFDNLEGTVKRFQSNLESMVTEVLDQLKPEL